LSPEWPPAVELERTREQLTEVTEELLTVLLAREPTKKELEAALRLEDLPD
jgi:hypothetical protein